jgi:hypothetical protein
MFTNQQMMGRFGYDATALDLNAMVRNLKYSNVELTERLYVDKPIKKQKEIPIEKKQELA